MFQVEKKDFRDAFSDAVIVIKEPSEAPGSVDAAELIVWEKAFYSPEVEELFSNNLWPEKILETFSIKNGWHWKTQNQVGKTAEELSDADTLKLVQSASGVLGKPAGNLHLSLKIREYSDTDSPLGDLAWWEEKGKTIEKDTPGVAVYNQLCQFLRECKKAGWNMTLEGVSLTIAKDESGPSFSPTSTLHSDRHHRPMEAGVCSIKEAGFDAGGTLSFPQTKMSDYPEDRDLTFENISPLVEKRSAILSESYDVFMFGGLKDRFNNVHNDNGLPHISRDPSGQSARLIFLLRNQHQGFSPQGFRL